MTELPEGWYATCERIAGWCARAYGSAGNAAVSYHDRYDAALGAILDHVAIHGWLPEDEPLFAAGAAGIQRAAYEASKHERWYVHWSGVRGSDDYIAEHVTDKIGVYQLCWGLEDAEWKAVWALASVMACGGGDRDAAALLGVTPKVLSSRLTRARARARGLWIASDETPRPMYRPYRRGARNRRAYWRHNRDHRARAAA